MTQIGLKRNTGRSTGWQAAFKSSVALFLVLVQTVAGQGGSASDDLQSGFHQPPRSARPWVYWFFMDGNLSREGITADLEAMDRARIGGCIMMEVDVGVPRGPVQFMSGEWQNLFQHAVNEAKRLGLQLALNAGPGWTGSGGPWVKPEQSMQHLVASETNVVGPVELDIVLPRPSARPPFFGEGGLPPAIDKARKEFYVDVAVLAFPTPSDSEKIPEIDEKALYVRAPYSSQPGVRPYFTISADFPAIPRDKCVNRDQIIDLTSRLSSGGRLNWSVPPGQWTIVRFGRTSTGQSTRPAPAPGLGLESDKFDSAALDSHFEQFVGRLLRVVGKPNDGHSGWTMLHIDSWEMGAQNWTARFREEFQQRRGYDPLLFLPVMTGRIVDSLEISERFLWDLRQTAQELVVENHARHLRNLAHKHGMGLSIEPYDMNPCSDLSLGGEADVPMCEFWARGFGFKTEFSVIEATSIAHTLGRAVVGAEAFTADDRERWQLYPGAIKAQVDWAFCSGVNRIVIHRYQHQPWLDRWPGMTMGPYGVHWERTQTWWEMVPAFHTYLARCQYLLQRGRAVADICYLVAEGAPHVFKPPSSAFWGDPPYRRGYNFDGCAPEVLINQMTVENGRLSLPSGASYSLLVLPQCETMTPRLLGKISELLKAGAAVLGAPPRKSPSLTGYPACDDQVKLLANEIWGGITPPSELAERRIGNGKVFWGGSVGRQPQQSKTGQHPITRAVWIWHGDTKAAARAPVGTRYFQKTFAVDTNSNVDQARITITADNAFELFLNGESVGTGNNFHQLYEFDVANRLKPGQNLISVRAENAGDNPNPAGLIASLEIQYPDGTKHTIVTDGLWRSSAEPEDTWPSQYSQSAAWFRAAELGPFDMPPWNKKPAELGLNLEQYPPYEVAIEVLRRLGVEPDFEADRKLGYTHRRDGECDIYFVANQEPNRVTARATFRVSGKHPELWDPLTGSCRDLYDFDETGGRTTIALRLEPHQAFFVVFRKPAKRALRQRPDFPESITTAEIQGPWELSFQPHRGAPLQARVEKLIDLATHPDFGVKHFSGIVTYKTTFEWHPTKRTNDTEKGNVWIDLGRVEVIASAKLNGRDLGIVWTPPFRADVTGAIKPGRNELEVRVANLWPNRLIADAGLPESERVTWTTWNPFKPGSALFASGLIGPVTVQVEVDDSHACEPNTGDPHRLP